MHGGARRQEGSSIVEFALVLPVLILVLAGVIDLGHAFHDYIVINNAAREGARFASHFPNEPTLIKETTRDEAINTGVTISTTQVSVDCLNANCSTTLSGDPITVTVRYGYRTLLLQIIGVRTITLTSRTQMVVFGLD
jgi:Flp pilus assembly protein TadG